MSTLSRRTGTVCACALLIAGSLAAKPIELRGEADFFPDSADWTLEGKGYHLFLASSFWPGVWLCHASAACAMEGFGYADSASFQIVGEWNGRTLDRSTGLFASLRAVQSAEMPGDLAATEYRFPVDVIGQIAGPGLDLRIRGRGMATNAVLAGDGTVAILALDHLRLEGTIADAPEPASLLPVAAGLALIAFAARRKLSKGLL